jgi:hypothetical protein
MDGENQQNKKDKKDKKGITKNLEEKQRYNKVIWRDTYKIADKYPCANAEKISQIDAVETMQQIIKTIKVFNEDLVDTIKAVVQANFKPLVLVNANDNYPMESVKHGSISPECDLYRCSNISVSTNDTLYPIRDLDMLYCPKITIFKTLENKMLAKPYQVSLLLMAPVRRPNLISIKTTNGMEDSYSNISEENKMKTKIENIFKIAVLKEYNCLILTDFGCQTEANPIKKVIEFFNEAIKKYPVKYVFFSIKSNEDIFDGKKTKDKLFEQFHDEIKRN